MNCLIFILIFCCYYCDCFDKSQSSHPL